MKVNKRDKDKKTISIYNFIDVLKKDLTTHSLHRICRRCHAPLKGKLVEGVRSLDEGDVVKFVCIKCEK